MNRRISTSMTIIIIATCVFLVGGFILWQYFGASKKGTVGWNCGDPIFYAGQSYNTLSIGSQCWFKQNLNAGTMTAGVNNQGMNCPSTAEIEKYCFGDSEENCTSDGALYQWGQAMCGSVTPGAQGICPTGWHIPTHDEWTTLERAVCDSRSCVIDFPYDSLTTGWRGTTEGTKLKSGGSSDFEGRLVGSRGVVAGAYDVDPFGTRRSSVNFWSSSESGSDAWRRLLGNDTKVARGPGSKTYGFSVRCLKD